MLLMMMMVRYFLRFLCVLLHLNLFHPLIYDYHKMLPMMDIYSHLLYIIVSIIIQ